MIAGPDQTHPLPEGSAAVVVLTATASDPEDPELDFVWDCGNGTGGTEQTVTCVYDTAGVFLASITVENDCGLVSADDVIVTIAP